MFSKKIVKLVILMNVVFTILVLAVFYKTGNEPAVLVGSWFAFTGTELWHLAQIKKHKMKGSVPNAGCEPSASDTESVGPNPYTEVQDPRD